MKSCLYFKSKKASYKTLHSQGESHNLIEWVFHIHSIKFLAFLLDLIAEFAEMDDY
jgi:hypothetical protein